MRETAEAMVDPRPGDVLLVIGVSNTRLAGACAAVTGLNGRAVVVGRGAAEQKLVESSAAAAGALIEFVDAPPTMLPLDSDTFDVVLIPKFGAPSDMADGAVAAEALRVARPAGRIIAICGERRAGILGALQTPAQAPRGDEVISLLKAAGGVAVRKLASQDGVSYFEARKPRPPTEDTSSGGRRQSQSSRR